jgi:hypothetical protein
MDKICNKCNETKDLSFFYIRKETGKVRNECRACMYKLAKARRPNYYMENKDNFRHLHYKRCYGITLQQYNQIFTEQGGKCAICKRHQKKLDRALAVDHIHNETKHIRGLLCSNCNGILGRGGDDAELFASMARYLKGETS